MMCTSASAITWYSHPLTPPAKAVLQSCVTGMWPAVALFSTPSPRSPRREGQPGGTCAATPSFVVYAIWNTAAPPACAHPYAHTAASVVSCSMCRALEHTVAPCPAWQRLLDGSRAPLPWPPIIAGVARVERRELDDRLPAFLPANASTGTPFCPAPATYCAELRCAFAGTAATTHARKHHLHSSLRPLPAITSPSLPPNRHHHHRPRSAPPCSACSRVLFASHTLVSAASPATPYAAPPRPFLSVHRAARQSVTRPLALLRRPLSSAIPPPAPWELEPQSLSYCLVHTPRTTSTHRSRISAFDQSAAPPLPSSLQTGKWRPRRPGFAFSQVSSSTGARHATGHHAD